MVYKISEVSNLETALLYPYRILRTASNTLSELLRYSEPFITQLTNYTTQSGVIEYRIDVELNPNKVPFIEFINADILSECADIYEVETTDKQLLIRTVSILSKPVDIAVYEVYSLQQITDLLSKLKAILDEKSAELDDTDTEADDIKIIGKWVVADGVKVPDLVMIDKDSDGLLFGDSSCILSGAVSSQQLVNPTQRLLESMLKCLTDQLTIKISDKQNRVFEGFYNGLLTIDAGTDILVFRNCRAVIQLNKITCETLIIDNCPFVFFKEDQCKIGTLEIRHSTVTINSDTEIDRIMLSRMSTVNQVQCKLGTLLLLEAGSTYYVPELNNDNTIEHVEIKAIQGQFCVNDKPVYLHHQNVSFRRGQVEDPVPISDIKIDIVISGGDTPTPTPEGKIYSPFTDWYWSGDSRVVQMIAATGTDGKGYGGEALAKLQEVQSEIESEGVDHNILLWWGVNGLYSGAQAYAAVYKNIANIVGDSAMVFVGTVGYCPNGSGSGRVDGGGGQPLDSFNDQIEQFNVDLKAELVNVSNIHVLDINEYIYTLEAEHGAAWLTSDNLHYLPAASQAIYDWVCNQITNTKQDYPDAPTSTNAGRIWNWFKYANIPNVSNRPELIAGIIGNCQQESYMAIDLLGSSESYYGPWCESNAGFRTAVTNAGFSFHPYTASPGDDSAAIPTIFTWLINNSPSWTDWLYDVINQVSSQTGEAGARAYAELFCVCIERCVGGSDAVLDPGVHQIMTDYYGGTVYKYQHLTTRRENAANIYNSFMGL